MNRFGTIVLGFFSFLLAVPQGLLAQKDTTFVADGNPLVKYKFVGDPAAMVYDGKVYIYGGHDECPPPALSVEGMVCLFLR